MKGLSWELLCVDDLVLVVEGMRKVLRWKECMEGKWMKINTRKKYNGDGFREEL